MQNLAEDNNGNIFFNSMERFKVIIDSLPDLMFIMDEDGLHLDVITSEENSLYTSIQEIRNKNLHEIFHKEIADNFLAHIKKTIEAGKTQTIEYSLSIGGEEKYYEARTALLNQKFNDKECLIWIAREITLRKEAEKALRQSEERMNSIGKALPDIIFVVDENGKYIEILTSRENLLYQTAENLKGRTFSEVFEKEAAAEFNEVVRKTIEEKKTQVIEYELDVPKGKRCFEGRTANLNFKIDNKNLVVFIARDITARKVAEEKLKESEIRYKLLYNKTPVMMKAIDIESHILDANEYYLNALGYKREEIIGKKSTQFVTDESRANIQKYLNPDLLKDGELRSTECQLIKRDGGLIDAEVFAAAELDRNGEIKQILSFFVDLSDRKRAESLQDLNVYLKEELKSESNYSDLIGISKEMKKVIKNIKMVAATDSTVLLLGETGVGKELVARAIYNSGIRKENVLITVNCGALPAGLIESELFGHEKGAFTGATALKKGKFELADKGTIFLDEVGELPMEMQVKLLRVLQEQEFERVGGSNSIKVDVRIIAATNRDLETEIKNGSFRADLYYRLNIFPINIPSLRERKEDIPYLANYFLQKCAKRIGKKINNINGLALEKLQNYNWPGNIRELANIIERAVILCQGKILQEEHIGRLVSTPVIDEKLLTLEEAEKRYILNVLDKTNGVMSGKNGAAEILGLNRSTLWSRMKKLGINISKQADG